MPNNPFDKLADLPLFNLTSTDVTADENLPLAQASGQMGVDGGQDASPHLRWSDAPPETQSFVITCYDPDAPTQSGFWHWALANVPASVTELPTNAGDPKAGLIPEGAFHLRNDAGKPGFLGAAPPAGHGPHRYFFVVHALDVPTLDGVGEDATPAFLGFNVFGHAIGRAYLVANFEQ